MGKVSLQEIIKDVVERKRSGTFLENASHSIVKITGGADAARVAIDKLSAELGVKDHEEIQRLEQFVRDDRHKNEKE